MLYSPEMIKEWGLVRFKNKILIAHEHFLNFEVLKEGTSVNKRKCIVGYIGRLSREKGALNFINSLLSVINTESSVKFLVGGEGPLKEDINRYLDDHALHEKVTLYNWIPHEHIYQYLLEIKLLVVPSYTEGLPNIMLEAMACGTPVLATPVGAIPEVIDDGKTGFIMADNSAECIAKNILRALNHPRLEQIAQNGRDLVQKEFTFEKSVAGYRNIFSNIISEGS